MATSLEEIMSFLYGDGEALKGWEGEELELVREAQQRFPGKPYCLVRKWILIDITTDGVERSSDGLPLMVIFAHEVVKDSRARFSPGHWVRTTYAVSQVHPCMFETKSTVYLLLGHGVRKQAGLHTVFSLHP